MTEEEELLTPDDAADLVEELLPAKIRSHQLGQALKIPRRVVDNIHSEFSDPRDQLFHVFIEFTNLSEPRPTWRVIVDALRTNEVYLPALADEVEAAHIRQPISTTFEGTAEGSEPSGSSVDKVKSEPSTQFKRSEPDDHDDDEEVKSKPSTQLTVEEVREKMKGLCQRFRLIRKSAIVCLEKCQVAAMTVLTLLSSIFGFDVRKAVLDKHHKDLGKVERKSELFGYLNLYWNYLAFKPFSVLIRKLYLKQSAFAGVRNEMAEYVKDVEKFREGTPLALFCQAVPYMERDPPPGLQTLVTEHQWPETATLGDVEGFKESFLGVFGLPECAMMMDGIRRGSFKVTWFVLLSVAVVQQLKGSKGRIRSFRDFKVTSVKIDGEYIYSVEEVQTTACAKSIVSDDRPDEPHITEEAFFRGSILLPGEIEMSYLEEPLKEYGILDETSFHVLQRWHGMETVLLDQMHYLMYILGKRENGLQILYYCLKKTQHRFLRHRRIVQQLESEAYRMKGSTSSTPAHGVTRKEMPHIDVSHSDATTTSKSTLTKSDHRDDEPQITEEVFFSEMLPILRVNVEVLVAELKEHGILLDESIVSSLMSSLLPPMDTIDELHYVMYRLGKKESGLQIFYRCLRGTQDESPGHRLVADRIESEARSITSRRNSAEAVPVHVTETGTAPSKIPLPVPSSPVESQQSSESQGAHVHSPSSPSEPEETVVYTGEACSHVSPSGISFHFPASESECRVELRYKVVDDDYILPKGYEDMALVSSMFKITASDDLPVPVTVQMEHCAIIDSLVHMIAHGPPPYYFHPLLSGTFPLGERYGEIQVKHFSIFTTLAKKLGLRLSLSVHVFYHDHSSATFVVTKNLRPLISAVENKYAGAKKGLEQSVLCGYETKTITLTVSDPPQEGGWCVEPLCEPAQIETKLIQEYRVGKTPPNIHLKMKWTGEGQAVEKDVRIAVGGTSIKSFFLLCRPAYVPDPSLASLSLSPQSQSAPFSPISPQLSLTSSDTPHQSQTPTSLHTPPTQHTGTPHLFQTPTSPPNQPTDTPHLSPSPHTPQAQRTDTPHMQPALPTDTPPAQRTDLLHPPPPAQHTDTPHLPLPPAQHAADHLGLSAESRALRRSNTVFTRGVDPENLVTVLYSNFLLTPEEKARAMKQTLTVGQQLEEIFQSLERRVSTRPQDFKIIIRALMAEPALKAVGDGIQEIYDKERAGQ